MTLLLRKFTSLRALQYSSVISQIQRNPPNFLNSVDGTFVLTAWEAVVRPRTKTVLAAEVAGPTHTLLVNIRIIIDTQGGTCWRVSWSDQEICWRDTWWADLIREHAEGIVWWADLIWEHAGGITWWADLIREHAGGTPGELTWSGNMLEV